MQRSLREVVGDVSGLAQDIMDGVAALNRGGGPSKADLERLALEGMAASAEALDELGQMLESARLSRQDAEPFADAIALVEQKLAFFQGCTMRRSAAHGRFEDEANGYADEAERLVTEVVGVGGLFELIQAYKRTEALEASVAELRETSKSGNTPEPRVLDLPRARVLVARRSIGAAVVELDSDDEEGDF